MTDERKKALHARARDVLNPAPSTNERAAAEAVVRLLDADHGVDYVETSTPNGRHTGVALPRAAAHDVRDAILEVLAKYLGVPDVEPTLATPWEFKWVASEVCVGQTYVLGATGLALATVERDYPRQWNPAPWKAYALGKHVEGNVPSEERARETAERALRAAGYVPDENGRAVKV